MRTRIVALSVLVAVPLAACGSDSNTISKREFLSKGNAICAAQQKKIDAVGKQAPELDLSSTLTKAELKQAGDFLDKGLAIQNSTIKQLRDLGTPKADTDKLHKIYDEADKGAGQIQDAADAAHAGNDSGFKSNYRKGSDTLDQAQKDINAYGLDKCGAS